MHLVINKHNMHFLIHALEYLKSVKGYREWHIIRPELLVYHKFEWDMPKAWKQLQKCIHR